MEYYCAPMEGVTDFLWRRLQREHFAAADCYFTPFLTPTQNHKLTGKERKEVLPENNPDCRLVPQLLGHNAEDMLWAIRELAAMGYTEVNLNLGCPSGTVVSKKKGAGLLAEPELLRALLSEIYMHSPIAVSVKTRIGMESPDEFPALLALFNEFPISCLTVHPRVRMQQYRGLPDMNSWHYAAANSRAPLCYNGNLFDRTAAEAFLSDGFLPKAVMCGRGAIANPKLFDELRGASPLTLPELRDFHDHLYAAVLERLRLERSTLLHMKELWYYMGANFEGAKQPLKKIVKSQSLADYTAAVDALFERCPLRDPAGFREKEV